MSMTFAEAVSLAKAGVFGRFVSPVAAQAPLAPAGASKLSRRKTWLAVVAASRKAPLAVKPVVPAMSDKMRAYHRRRYLRTHPNAKSVPARGIRYATREDADAAARAYWRDVSRAKRKRSGYSGNGVPMRRSNRGPKITAAELIQRA